MPFQGFVDEFTNSPVQPAFSTYLQLSITDLNPPVQPGAQTSPIQLDWANLDQSTANPFSQVVKVIFNDNAANTIKLPDATLSSVQQTILFANTTETAYNVVDFNNNEVTTVLSGQVWFIALTDNTANDGINTWFPEVFGGVNTPANAAALVGPGYGLLASNGLIVENNIVVYLNAADTPYTIQSTDRGHYLIWDGTGSYTINLPVTAALPSAFSNGFIFALATTKTAGPITINAPTGQTIDGQPFLIISADKSTFLVADGEFGWSSLGYEVTINSTVTINDVELIGGDINITLDQSTSIIQNFVNNQAGPSLDSNITFQTTIPQQYIMSNLVTNPDTVIATVLPNTINAVYTLASGETCSFFMDQTIGLSPSSNKFFAANGSAENPIFQNIGDPATGSGIYFTSDTGFPAITQGGNKVIDFSYEVNGGNDIATLSSPAYELNFTLKNQEISFIGNPTTTSILATGNSLTLGQVFAPQITLGNLGGTPAIRSGNDGTVPLQIIASNLTLNGSTAIALSAPTTTITATTGTTVTTPLLNVVGNLDVSGTITGGGLPSLPISIANGGTGQITQPLAIKALSAYTAQGQMLYSADGTGTIGYIAPPSTYGKTLITTVNSAAQVPAWSGNSILQVKHFPVADQGTPSGLVPYTVGANIGSAIVFTPTPGNLNGRLLISATIFDLAGDTSSPSIELNVNGTSIESSGSILYGVIYSPTAGGGSAAYTTVYPLTSANPLTFQFVCGNYSNPAPSNYFSKLLSLTITEFAGGPF